MPRHPPCALDNLTNTPTPATHSSSKHKATLTRGQMRPYKSRKKMLASTLHLTTHPHTTTPTPENTRAEVNECPEKNHHPHQRGPVVLSGPNSAPTFLPDHEG